MIIDILSTSTESLLHSADAITSAQVGIAVIKKMNMKQYRSKNVDIAAQSFAVDLHDKWGVGGVDGKENGILVFLSIEDRVVYISTGRDVKKVVTQRDIEVLIAAIKPDLRKKDYGTAIQNIVLRIDMLLNPNSEVRKTYGESKYIQLLIISVSHLSVCRYVNM